MWKREPKNLFAAGGIRHHGETITSAARAVANEGDREREAAAINMPVALRRPRSDAANTKGLSSLAARNGTHAQVCS